MLYIIICLHHMKSSPHHSTLINTPDPQLSRCCGSSSASAWIGSVPSGSFHVFLIWTASFASRSFADYSCCLFGTLRHSLSHFENDFISLTAPITAGFEQLKNLLLLYVYNCQRCTLQTTSVCSTPIHYSNISHCSEKPM